MTHPTTDDAKPRPELLVALAELAPGRFDTRGVVLDTVTYLPKIIDPLMFV